jgi:predicted exporter
LAEAVANTIDNLSSPVGLMLKPFLARDPTGELLAVVDSLNPGAQPETRAGVWASRDGERALLLLQTRALGSDTDGQERTIAGVRSAFDQAVQASGHSQLVLHLSGPGQFAEFARHHQERSPRLFLISTLHRAGVALGLPFPRLPALSCCRWPAVPRQGPWSAWRTAPCSASPWAGSALIGEAVDCAIYFFVQSGRLAEHLRQAFCLRSGCCSPGAGLGALCLGLSGRACTPCRVLSQRHW